VRVTKRNFGDFLLIQRVNKGVIEDAFELRMVESE
jgi:hypothetical protein